jgi:hypothetical protein
MSFGRQQTGFFVMTSLHFFIKIFLQSCDNSSHPTLLIFNVFSVVEYREAEYRDHKFQDFYCYFGLDTAEKHRLLDQRSTFEPNCLVANNGLVVGFYRK